MPLTVSINRSPSVAALQVARRKRRAGGTIEIAPRKIQCVLPLNLFSLFSTVACAEDESMGPVFVKEPPNRVDFSNGTGAVVECQARGNPQPDIIWVRADGSAVGDVPGLRQVSLYLSRREL